MRTMVKDHNKKRLANKVFNMVEHEGWEPLTPITYDDPGFHNCTISYYCIMEKEGEQSKKNFNNPYGW